MERGTVVTNQPLPSEFERQRKPYNQIPVNHSERNNLNKLNFKNLKKKNSINLLLFRY